MFSVGETVIYGNMGVCTVEAIGKPDMPGAERECYILKPHYVSGSTVYAPIENNPVKMRPVITREKAQSLIDSLPEIKPFAADKERQELYDTYKSALRSADSFLLAKLVKTLYARRVLVLEQRKTVPSVEKEYLETATKMLHGEIACALQMPLPEVEGYIAGRLEPSRDFVNTAVV